MGLSVATPIYKARTGETGVLSTSGLGPYTLPNLSLGNGLRTLAIGYSAYTSCPVVVCIEDTVTYAWELMIATYAVALGTLTRTQTIDSSTGSAVAFGSNPCNITVESPPPGIICDGTTLNPGSYQSGKWYDNGGIYNSGAYIGWTSTYIFSPIIVFADHIFTGLGTYCGVAPGAPVTLRLGAYSDTGFGGPGALAVDAGNLVISTTGQQVLTGLSFFLPRGLNWICYGTPSTLSSAAFYGIMQSNSLYDFTNFMGSATPFAHHVSTTALPVNLEVGGYTPGNPLPATAPSASPNGNSPGWAGALLA